MSRNRSAPLLISWMCCIVQFACCDKLQEIGSLTGLSYNTQPTTWLEAAKGCRGNTATLVLPNDLHHAVSAVKRAIHIANDSGSWVGDYTSYEVLKDVRANTSIHMCVALHIKSEKVLDKQQFLYEYDLIAVNCTLANKAMCTENNNTINVQTTESEWIDACGGHKLWTPLFSTIPVSRGGEFGFGNFTSTLSNPNLINNIYWVSLLLEEIPTQIPVLGNIFRCGYISFYGTGIDYSDCFEQKGFICETDNSTSDIPREGGSMSHTAGGLYAGIAAAVIVTMCVVTVVLLLMKRLKTNGLEKINSEVPHGGRSFTRKNKDDQSTETGQDNSQAKEENRITTYNQIYMDNHSTDELPEDTIDTYDSAYASVNKQLKDTNKPDVIPRVLKSTKPHISQAGYLTMNGQDSCQSFEERDNEYDFLESTRSTTSTSYTKIETDDGTGNIYGLASSGEPESTYNVTFERQSNQNTMSDTDYDHVSIDRSETMRRNTCDSITGKTQPTVVHMASPRSNPTYDRVIIQ